MKEKRGNSVLMVENMVKLRIVVRQGEKCCGAGEKPETPLYRPTMTRGERL
jgi:hypothetical protein